MNMHTHDFINPRQNLPAEDPLGIEAWSLSRGLEPHTGLALVACVLNGVVGPMRSSQFPTPGSSGCNFIANEADGLVSMAATELIQPLCYLQDSFVTNARRYTDKELEDAMYGDGDGMRLRNAKLLDQLRSPSTDEASSHDPCAESTLSHDTKIAMRLVLFEKQVRPQCILTGGLRGDLAKTLGSCHHGMGFASGTVVSLPSQTGPRNRRIDEILEGLRGIVTKRPSHGGHPVDSPETVVLSGLLRFPESDFQWIINHRKDLPAAALPISSFRSGNGMDEPEVDEARASEFLTLFDAVANNALASRRAHHWLHKSFFDGEAANEYLRSQRSFLREIQNTQRAVTVHGAASLPARMAWALLLLAGENNVDSYILDTVFEAARRFHADTLALFDQKDRETLMRRRLTVARKMVARVSKIGPCKRRDLVRGLDQHALPLHEPIIRVLISQSIIVEDATGLLSLGRVSLRSLAPAKLIDTSPT